MKYSLLLTFLIIFFACNRKNNDTILTNEETTELKANNKRKQITSLDQLILLDTVKLIYLIPVGQRFLDEAENIEDGRVLGLLNSRSSYKNRGYYGYNNFLLYFEKERRTINIFSERFLLNLLEIKSIKNDMVLIFEGINKDSNKNGEYDSNDIKSLFIYSFQTEKLVEIFLPYSHLLTYHVIPETKNLIIQYGVDRDSNGVYISKDEPMNYVQFNFETSETFNLVNDTIMNKIQIILDGKSN